MKEILEIFWLNPIWQTFWILWMITVISAFLQRDDTKVIKILIFAHIFWAGHFYLMEIYSWLWVVIIWTLRLLMSMKYKKNDKIFLGVLFVTLLLGIFTYKDMYSIFPIIASCLWTYGYFYLEKVRLRLLLLVVSAFWFSFHYVHFSIGWVVNESIIQVVHLLTIYRIMIEQWGTRAYLRIFRDRYLHKPKIDYGRYLSVIDFIMMRNKK